MNFKKTLSLFQAGRIQCSTELKKKHTRIKKLNESFQGRFGQLNQIKSVVASSRDNCF